MNLIFKLEHSPDGYHREFAPNCQVEFPKEGSISFNDEVVGKFTNMNFNGELLLADITLFNKYPIEPSYSVSGAIIKANESKEITKFKIKFVMLDFFSKENR